MIDVDPYEYDELAEAAIKGWDDEPALIEGAVDLAGEWQFDATTQEGTVALTPEQHAAAVRIVDEPENAECERGETCMDQRPTLIVGGEVRKYGADFIGFHLAEDPDTGHERMRFKPFYVTADGIAICEECAEGHQA